MLSICKRGDVLRRVYKTTVAVKVAVSLEYFCVCVCECVHVLSCACGCGRGCMGAIVWFRTCSLINPSSNATPYCHVRPLWLQDIFPHYLINGTTVGKKLLNIKCVLWLSLQLLFETFLTLRRIQRDIVINVRTSSCNVSVILFGLQQNLNFLDRFSKKAQISSLTKIRLVEADLFLADRQTRQTSGHDANSRFSQFYKRAWEVSWNYLYLAAKKGCIFICFVFCKLFQLYIWKAYWYINGWNIISAIPQLLGSRREDVNRPVYSCTLCTTLPEFRVVSLPGRKRMWAMHSVGRTATTHVSYYSCEAPCLS